jgi:hypothetical protein
MKFTGAVVASLLATSAAAFDKYQRTSPILLHTYTPRIEDLLTNNNSI